MNEVLLRVFASIAASLALFTNVSAAAQTRVEQIALEAPDGDRITGFIYQGLATDDNAPVAILMHGLGGSSLSWLANDQAFYVDKVTRNLIEQGYRVAALDARSHGARMDEISPIDRLKSARSGEAGPYLAMINGTVEDYGKLLDVLTQRFGKPDHVIAIGYSMGAQMAVLFAAENPLVSHIVTMVPPAATSAPQVAPVNHARLVRARWLLITASADQFSTTADNEALALAAGDNLTRIEFESGHRLPSEYTLAVSNWIAAINE